MQEDYVDGGEELYRRIPNDSKMFSIIEGKLRFSSTAFNDRGMKPSVDRAKLRSEPRDTMMAASDGVASLIAGEIRNISIEKTNPLEDSNKYSIDVVPRPISVDNPEGLPVNLAHAQVETDPVLESPSRFKKLKEALALLAGQRDWLVKPS